MSRNRCSRRTIASVHQVRRSIAANAMSGIRDLRMRMRALYALIVRSIARRIHIFANSIFSFSKLMQLT